MGTKSIEIVGMSVEELLTQLNKAYSDEWLAYHQYWLGAKIAKGPMRDVVTKELMEHAAEELHHVELLTTRIIQLGGTPVISPKKWYDMTNCGYDEPRDPQVRILLEQNIKAEQCAIASYNKILQATLTADPVTYGVVLEILENEVEHEEDLQTLLEDYELTMNRK
ncbi:MAG TPA: ferritin-like domain-containing protein [Chitinispirillaceae bacterium]|nr:ferritin-like domain-containing protein [Chitinispirillaceae bacterium]